MVQTLLTKKISLRQKNLAENLRTEECVQPQAATPSLALIHPFNSIQQDTEVQALIKEKTTKPKTSHHPLQIIWTEKKK